MSYFVIGDDVTVTGFRLAGVAGRVARTPYEAREALTTAAATEGVNIILITEPLAGGIKEALRHYYPLNFPLIITICDRKGPTGERKSIREMIKAAMGISV